MKRALFAGKGAPDTIGGEGIPKNHGWQTEIEPETMPEHVFQVKGELGNEAPTAIAIVLTNPMAAGTTSNRATGVSPGTYGRTLPSGVRMRARNPTPRVIRVAGKLDEPAQPTHEGPGRAQGRESPCWGSRSKVLDAGVARPLGVLMRSDPTQGHPPRDGAGAERIDASRRAGIGYGQAVPHVAAVEESSSQTTSVRTTVTSSRQGPRPRTAGRPRRVGTCSPSPWPRSARPRSRAIRSSPATT